MHQPRSHPRSHILVLPALKPSTPAGSVQLRIQLAAARELVFRKQQGAAVMSLIHSAKLNELEPYAYLRDVLELLPTQPASRINELLPHCWRGECQE